MGSLRVINGGFVSYRCPNFDLDIGRCEGTLEFQTLEETTLGTLLGIDGNCKTETFRCNKCGIRVQRSYQWKKFKIQEKIDERK